MRTRAAGPTLHADHGLEVVEGDPARLAHIEAHEAPAAVVHFPHRHHLQQQRHGVLQRTRARALSAAPARTWPFATVSSEDSTAS